MKMMPDVSVRSMLKNNDYGEDLSLLFRQQRQEEVAREREKELNLYRSGSAPPTVERSLSAVGRAVDVSLRPGFDKYGHKEFLTEEEVRADPAYVNYYYSNVNLNPRLPPPLLSKENWRFTQRLQDGGLGGIGDRRRGSRDGSGNEVGNGNGSLFSLQGGNGGKEDDRVDSRKSMAEWGDDGMMGLQGLRMGTRQKNLADMIQDDLSNGIAVSWKPSHPATRNAFEDKIETSDAQAAYLHQDMTSMNGFYLGANKQGSSASHSYASALGSTLSRSSTPELARAPSPLIPPVGVGRVSSMDKRGVCSPNSFIGVSPHLSESADLMAAFSGINLSTTSILDDKSHSNLDIQQEIGDHHYLFNFQGDQDHVRNSLNKSDSEKFHVPSAHHLAKGSYMHNSLLMADKQCDTNRPVVSSTHHILKVPSALAFNGRNSPSHYQNVDKVNSIQNYGFSGYNDNLSSASMMGNQMESSNLPPLFENAAAAAAYAMGVNGINARALGRGLPGSKLLEASAEFQNIGRFGDQTAGSALYHQFLMSNEYATAQVPVFSDPTLDNRECIGNSYMDLLGAQKAHIGMLLSPQKSQYAVPSIADGYYGSQAFNLGMMYPGSQLTNPLLPNSPVGLGCPVGQSDRSLSFSPGIRNLAVGVRGAWNLEAVGNLEDSFAASLLDEFKCNKAKCFNLSEIAGHVVDFSADQYGSRFIQQKLETASTEEKNMVFHEILPQALSLMTDVFGNYVIQKFFEHGSAPQVRELADQLTGHVLALSLQMYGCRVIQKAIEVVDLDQQIEMVKELDGQIMRCVRDQNGNHVIQKCIECVPENAIQFIVSTFYDQVVTLSTHPYGCRVIQRVLEHCHDPKTQSIMMDEILRSVCLLAQDQYGNYVVQHVLEHGKPDERSAMITKLTGQIVQMSQQKFASNVIEKCLTFGTPAERQEMVTEMLGTTDENEPLQVMMKDQFANYVVQKVLETCDDQQLELILNRIKVHLNALKKYTYGKHIVARVEKLVAAGERRIGIMTPQPALMA